MQVSEEQAFYILARVLKGHNLRSFYTEDLNGVRVRMFQMDKLVQTLFPTMYLHLEKLGVSIGLLLTPWFMTAFSYQLPLDVAFRVMDILLVEGITTLFRFALAILLMCEQEILLLDVEAVRDYFRKLLREKFQDPDELISVAYGVTVSVSQLHKLEQEYIDRGDEINGTETKKEIKTPEKSKMKANQMMVEIYELRGKLSKAELQLSELTEIAESHKSKAETEKLALVGQLGDAMEKNALYEQENGSLKEKLKITSNELIIIKKMYEETKECEKILAEELYEVRKMTQVKKTHKVNFKILHHTASTPHLKKSWG